MRIELERNGEDEERIGCVVGDGLNGLECVFISEYLAKMFASMRSCDEWRAKWREGKVDQKLNCKVGCSLDPMFTVVT